MINIRWLLIAWIGAGLLAGCGLFRRDGDVITGSGEVTRETRAVSGIQAVALQGSGEVIISQGADEALVVEAEDNLLPFITTTVEGDTLVLGFDRATWRESIQPTQPIRFLLTVRDLSALDLAGAGRLTASSLEVPRLRLDLTGAGDIQIDHLEADDLSVSLSGQGDIVLGGRVSQQAVQITGTGNYAAGDLESQAADVDLAGTGDITLWVHDQLDVSLRGSGSVSYFGTPTVGRREITGLGDINPMGEK